MQTSNYKMINGHFVFDNANVGDLTSCANGDSTNSGLYFGFEELYKYEERYFWFVARRQMIAKYMAKYVPKEDSVIEVGAGTGGVSAFLAKKGYKNISIAELDMGALDFARHYGLERRYCFNLLDAPFESAFDCVCAFDVLEHIEDDTLALQNMAKMLNNTTSLAAGGGGAK